MLRHELSCVELVQQYLSRIEQHNKVLRAIIHVNPNALEIARKLDASLASSGTLSGALHCVPVAVKDAIDTAEMPTGGGSTAPSRAAQSACRRHRRGQAARSRCDHSRQVQSLMNSVAAVPGSAPSAGRRATRTTPHASPAAPAAAPASPSRPISLLVALSEETGVSIRNPAANNNIVGIAPTQGLVSRAGVIPISFTQDRVGAYARTAADAALLLQVMAGYDADDPATAASRGRVPREGYAASPTSKGLAEARLGVVRQFMTAWTAADKEVGGNRRARPRGYETSRRANRRGERRSR